MAKDSKFLEFLVYLTTKRKNIYLYTLIVAIVSITVSLLLPKWYKSSATIVSTNSHDINSLGSMISDLPLGGMMSSFVGGGSDDFSLLTAILKSRKLKDIIIKEFDLINIYGFEGDFYYENVLKTFDSNVEIEESEDGTLIYSIIDKDPIRAKNMVNRVIIVLDSINKSLRKESARFQRDFLEARIDSLNSEITISENEFQELQQKESFIALSPEMMSNVSAGAEIQAQKEILDIKYSVLKNQLQPGSSELKKIKLQIEAYKRKINSIPPVLKKSMRLIRDLEIKYTVLKFLIPQYEQAKINEVKNTPTVQILDGPYVATKKEKPKRSVIVIIFTLLGFGTIVSYYSLKYRYNQQQEQNNSNSKKLAYVINNIFKPWGKDN